MARMDIGLIQTSDNIPNLLSKAHVQHWPSLIYAGILAILLVLLILPNDCNVIINTDLTAMINGYNRFFHNEHTLNLKTMQYDR